MLSDEYPYNLLVIFFFGLKMNSFSKKDFFQNFVAHEAVAGGGEFLGNEGMTWGPSCLSCLCPSGKRYRRLLESVV